MQKTIAIVFGTRPEAIKMAPVVKSCLENGFNTNVIVTAQHRHMLDQVLDIFDIKPDYDLDIMTENQTLFDITEKTLVGIKPLFAEEKPDILLVQGDTTTAFASALAAFYLKIPVGHIEAGLRTGDKTAPYPEEMNRTLVSRLADFHFAPTKDSESNLQNEGITENVFVTGNTVIDALLFTASKLPKAPDNKEILVTLHRRESWGEPAERICLSLKEIATKLPKSKITFSVHKNPAVRKTVNEILGNIKIVKLLEPLDYVNFVKQMNNSYLILTDSGGIQEEAPSLNKPVLVLREKTERPEAVKSGAVKLVGTDIKTIVNETLELINNKDSYDNMAAAENPFGNGTSAKQIVSILKDNL